MLSSPDSDLALSAFGTTQARRFAEQDPYSGCLVEGLICEKQNDEYGSLVITAVDGSPVPAQHIRATPKMHYPFYTGDDGSRVYTAPPIRRIQAYEKIDGTNVLAFSYRDATGNPRTSFKLRRTPFIKANQYGNFPALWNEILEQHALIWLSAPQGAVSAFELYGFRNRHVVDYPDIPLDAVYLFSRTGTGIHPPIEDQVLPAPPLLKDWVFPIPSPADFVEIYNDIRRRAGERNARGLFTEGAIIYAETMTGEIIPYKCKTEQLEEIHWGSEPMLSTAHAEAAAQKVIEAGDPLTAEAIAHELLEDWSPKDIHAAFEIGLLTRVAERLRERTTFERRIWQAYLDTRLDFQTDRIAVMRALGPLFPKGDLGRVFSYLATTTERSLHV